MPLVMINQSEAKRLGKKWGRPANSDQAVVRGQPHKVYNLSPSEIARISAGRKGVKVKRKGFEYKAFPGKDKEEEESLEDLIKRFEKAFSLGDGEFKKTMNLIQKLNPDYKDPDPGSGTRKRGRGNKI